MLGLFTNPESVVYLIFYMVGCTIAVYGVLFWIFFALCRFPGSLAIRWAWTVGILGMLISLTSLSSVHAQYLMFWTGDTEAILDSSLLGALLLAFLAYVWLSMPRLGVTQASEDS